MGENTLKTKGVRNIATRMLAEANPLWEKYINSDRGAGAIWAFAQPDLRDPDFFEKLDRNKWSSLAKEGWYWTLLHRSADLAQKKTASRLNRTALTWRLFQKKINK
jgi:hypothetical protein